MNLEPMFTMGEWIATIALSLAAGAGIASAVWERICQRELDQLTKDLEGLQELDRRAEMDNQGN